MAHKFMLAAAIVVAIGVALRPGPHAAAAEQAPAPAVTEAQGMTAAQSAEILDELRQIRRLLERAQQPTEPRQAALPDKDDHARIGIENAMTMGRADAPITLVEFTDLQCPYCRQFHMTAFEQIKKNWIDTGKLRFVSRDFPLDMHEHAMSAALALRCAGEQHRFWEMRQTLTVNATNLTDQDISGFARRTGLDMDEFGACADAEKFKSDILVDIDAGRAAGVSGTPTFILGRSKPNEVEGVMIVGAQPYATFNTRIRELLGE